MAEEFDCLACGACCAWFNVPLNPDDVLADEFRITRMGVPRMTYILGTEKSHAENHCAFLEGEVGAQVRCRIYETRPGACRDFPVGCSLCVTARKAKGLPVGESED